MSNTESTRHSRNGSPASAGSSAHRLWKEPGVVSNRTRTSRRASVEEADGVCRSRVDERDRLAGAGVAELAGEAHDHRLAADVHERLRRRRSRSAARRAPSPAARMAALCTGDPQEGGKLAKGGGDRVGHGRVRARTGLRPAQPDGPHPGRLRGHDVAVERVADDDAVRGREPEASRGQAEDLGVGLGDADPSGVHDHADEGQQPGLEADALERAR